MERNIGDQLNKAFEAYRQVSIEKDNAKKQLQQMVKKTKAKAKKKKRLQGGYATDVSHNFTNSEIVQS